MTLGDWALEKIDEFIAIPDTRDAVQTPESKERATDRLLTLTPIVQQIAQRYDVRTDNALHPSVLGQGYGWSQARTAAVFLRGAVASRSEVLARLGVRRVVQGVEALHRWVRDAAETYWKTGARTDAVRRAGEAVNQHLQDKLGRPDMSGSALAFEAFGISPVRVKDDDDPPDRLRFPGIDPAQEDTYKSAHEGAMHYAVGCFKAIRNLATHVLDELEEQEAFERLAALSVLARMIEEAEVRPAEIRKE